MQASILDLRYKMSSVLKALDRNEEVEILYHGKPKALLKPIQTKKRKNVMDSPLFGCLSEDNRNVNEIIDKIRGTRYDF